MSSKNDPFQGTVEDGQVGRHICMMGLFIGRWDYSVAVLPQQGKTFVPGERLPPSFFWGTD